MTQTGESDYIAAIQHYRARKDEAFGSSPETWLGMQMAYDLRQARERMKTLRVRSFKAA